MPDRFVLIELLTNMAVNGSTQIAKAARYVGDNLADAAAMSQRQVAQEADVSQSTVSRLVKELGYARHLDFRRDCGGAIGGDIIQHADSVNLREMDELAYHVSETSSTCDKRYLVDSAKINASHQKIDAYSFDRFGSDLHEAERIHLVGSDGVRHLLNHFATIASHSGHSWSVVSADTESQARLLSQIGTDDAILAVQMEPDAKREMRFIRHAKSNGASIFGVVDSVSNPVFELREIRGRILLVSPIERRFFPSQAGLFLLLESIVETIFYKSEWVVTNSQKAMAKAKFALQ